MRRKDYGVDLSDIVFNSYETDKSIKKNHSSIISKDEALDAGKIFASRVRESIDPDALIYLFGSAINGTADVGSDIDVAVVSKVFDDDVIREAGRMSSMAQGIHSEIEVHAVAVIDWLKGNPHTYEIQRWGIAV